MKLKIEPQIALVDERVSIYVTNLKPYESVEITAEMSFPWAMGEKYKSSAIFKADENGNLDLDKQKPDRGNYDFVDSMGLIISLEKVDSIGENIAENLTIVDNLKIKITAKGSKKQESVVLERMFKSPDVKIEKINDGFIGEFYYTKNSNHKTIVLIGGSDGNLNGLSLMAGPLASRGFNVLSVAYFGEKGLPNNLQEIPIQYFERVFSFIKENPLICSDEIYIHGTSKGGELALILASKYNFASKVAVSAPHAYCFQGLNGMMTSNNVSSWSHNGKPMAFIALQNNILFEDQKESVKTGKPFGFANCYKQSVEMAENKEEARIKIENANADLLFIAGKVDGIWNAYEGCREMMEALRKNNYKHKYEFLSYETMGHTLPIPYIIPLSESLSLKIGEAVFSSGGTIQGNAFGQYDSWKKTIEFFER